MEFHLAYGVRGSGQSLRQLRKPITVGFQVKTFTNKIDFAASRYFFYQKIIPDAYTVLYALGSRAESQVMRESISCLSRFSFSNFQVVFYSNLCDLQDIIDILDISFYLSPIMTFSGLNFTFGQH